MEVVENPRREKPVWNVLVVNFGMRISALVHLRPLLIFLNTVAGQQSSIAWFCRSCEAGTKRIQMMITAIDGRICELEILTEAVESLTSKINSLAVARSTSDTSYQDNGQPLSNAQTNIFSSKTIMVSEVTNELKEREKRALNVVFNGAKDKEHVLQFLRAADWETPAKILEITTQSKKTLFIVTMNSEKDKWTLIGKARKLSSFIENLKNMFINPDLTKSEREIQFKLREEVRRKRGLGELVKISRGRVIEVKS